MISYRFLFKEFIGPRIISGEDAKEDRYPYFVSLRSSLSGRHMCGGTLIAPDIVLTAAHCFGAESVWAGLYRQSDPLGTLEELSVREEIPHPLRRSINVKDHGEMK
jgi:secreted trypsin-like serine protease